jgi:hypothetical protein
VAAVEGLAEPAEAAAVADAEAASATHDGALTLDAPPVDWPPADDEAAPLAAPGPTGASDTELWRDAWWAANRADSAVPVPWRDIGAPAACALTGWDAAAGDAEIADTAGTDSPPAVARLATRPMTTEPLPPPAADAATATWPTGEAVSCPTSCMPLEIGLVAVDSAPGAAPALAAVPVLVAVIDAALRAEWSSAP